jgi:hypothetical protein
MEGCMMNNKSWAPQERTQNLPRRGRAQFRANEKRCTQIPLEAIGVSSWICRSKRNNLEPAESQQQLVVGPLPNIGAAACTS